MTDPGRRAKGFTLFELIIVLVIAGMTTSIIAPRLVNSLGNMNTKTTAKKIAASLRYARSKAASEKIPYAAVFDFYSNQLIIKKNINDEELTDKDIPQVYPLLENIRFKQGVSPAGDIYKSEPFYIIFYPGGGSSGGSITISDAREREQTINIDFITGIVNITIGTP